MNIESGKMTASMVALAIIAMMGLIQAADQDGIQESKDTITMRLNGKPLWTFNHRAEEGKPYVHPLATTTGQVFSDLRPKDHPWHRALWFSWKYINGVNYWEENPATGKSRGQTLLLSVERNISQDKKVSIQMALAYAPVMEIKHVMQENRTVIISPPDKKGAYTIDWLSEFRALDKDVVLDRTPLPEQSEGKDYGGYAGYSVRMNKDVRGGTFLSSKGLTGNSAHRQPARWMIYSSIAGGSLLLMDHRTNLRYPAKWYVAENMPYFSPAVIHDAPHTIKAGKSLSLQYRLVVCPTAVDARFAEKQWRVWSEESAKGNKSEL
ncbi:MAG: PmoA family protein [Verrucomicrobiae bacterium]|nr:PmoA family protein [Verrucomicrobiae bacterium]NNJ42356.1 PmoA family protein [Akkermansiaceae bacterium]